jgi:hypothetical protein
MRFGLRPQRKDLAMKSTRRMSSNPPNGRIAQTGAAIKEQVAHVPEQLASVVDERPLATVAVAFGMGLVAGAGLVALYCQMNQQQPTTLESLSQRITDAIRSALPQNLSSFRA